MTIRGAIYIAIILMAAPCVLPQSSYVNDCSELKSTLAPTGQVITSNASKGASWENQDGGPFLSDIVGEVRVWADNAVPDATWQFCDGQAISRTTYSDLFAIIGTTYGIGDGSTTFNIPDLRGRMVVGEGPGIGLTSRSLADTGGAETHVITTSENAEHVHDIWTSDGGIFGSSPNPPGSGSQLAVVGVDIPESALPFVIAQMNDSSLITPPGGATDGGNPSASHAIMAPFLALNFIIKVSP